MRKDLFKSLAKIEARAICFALCFTVFNSFGQNDKVLTGDTAFWFKYQNEQHHKLGMPSLISLNDSFHFRFSTDNQVIDLWSEDGKTFKSSIISFINSYSYDGKRKVSKPPKLFTKQVDLDTVLARKVFDLTKTISKVPSDKYIKGWVDGLDGTEYLFETSTPTTYEFRAYWTLSAQDSSIFEVKLIKHFIKNLDSLLNLSNKYNEFFRELKPGSYTNGYSVTTKLTHKQSEYYKKMKPYNDYLNTVGGKLDKYLSDTLTKIFQRYGDLKCFSEILLKFSTNNRLIKIITNDEFSDETDKKQYLAARKKIKEAFKSISIDFVHSKIPYWRKLNFSQGKVDITSDRIY